MKKLFFLFLFLILSCETNPDLKTTVSNPEVQNLPLSSVIQELKKRAGALHSVQGVCQVNSHSESNRGNFSAILLVKKPDRFRLVGYRSFLGSTNVLDLLVTPDQFHLYLPTENKLIEGSGSHPRFFTGNEMLASFFGLAEAKFLLLEETWDSYFFALVSAEGERFLQTLKVQKQTLWITEQSFYHTDGSKSLQIRYENYRQIGEIHWPDAVTIVQMKPPHHTLQIRFKEVDLNITLQPEAFLQDIPEEAIRETIKSSP